MKKITFTLIAVFTLLNNVQAQFGMKTVAEATDYRSTSRYKDVMQFIRELEKASPYIRTETIATTVEGRDYMCRPTSMPVRWKARKPC